VKYDLVWMKTSASMLVTRQMASSSCYGGAMARRNRGGDGMVMQKGFS